MSRMYFSEQQWTNQREEAKHCSIRARQVCEIHADSSSPQSDSKPHQSSGFGALRCLAVGLAVLAGSFMFAATPVLAQEASIMSSGDLAVTGFSGTQPLADGSIDKTFIDVNGASLRIFAVGDPGLFQAQLLNPQVKSQAYARDIGQIFGLALDNAASPNIYVTATSVHGLQIVGADADGDGIPDRLKTGQAGAQFMDGQFGTMLGGGPGSVWKIDGITGDISLFANIESGGQPNSGPGLGNIAYDPSHYQFYVSDLDTGVIHRLGIAGDDLGTFDHGIQGRPSAGLDMVMIDPANRMDITSPSFDAENSDTWGLTDLRRRVWGLSYYKGRLYYAVEEGPQIWSVAIASDGSFAGDARTEIELVPGGFSVSDILFTPRGRMIIAQRGGILGSYDYTQFHTAKANQVLRYLRDNTGNWVQEPDQYAIGFPFDHNNTSGGVGLACDNILWSTGDALRDNPVLADRLSAGGEAVVHGVQGNSISLVRPRNVPPWNTVFVDYDDQFGDLEKAGHVGDVEVYRLCEGGRAETWPGWTPGWIPPPVWIPPPRWPRTPDLEIEKSDAQCTAIPGIVPIGYQCTFTITITNVSLVNFVGHLSVIDNVPPDMVYVPPPGGSIPWNCAQQPAGPGNPIYCTSQNVETLLPGQSETLEITIQTTPAFDSNTLHNCAILDHPGDPNGNNEDCGDGYPPGPDLEIQKTLNRCISAFESDGGGHTVCTFWLDVINWGTVDYNGPLHIVDNLPPGAIYQGIVDQSPAGWNCAVIPGVVDCIHPGVTLAANGGWAWVEISIFIPFGAGGDLENCVHLGDPEHAGDPDINGTNAACVPFSVPDGCPAGWTIVPPGGAPSGWWVIVFDGFNPDGTKWGFSCMKPSATSPAVSQPDRAYCPRGWKRFANSTSVPQGWVQKRVVSGNSAIICARYTPPPPPEVCPKGWREILNWNSVPQSWIKRRVGKLICAKPQLVRYCPKGWSKFSNWKRVPESWTKKRVGKLVCARPGRCPTGMTGVPPNCRKVVIKHCPQGTKGRWPNCIKVIKRCPTGMTGVPPNCRKVVIKHCPQGTKGRWPNCIKVIKRCPTGMTGVPPNCRKVVIKHCPQGTKGRWPNCIKVIKRCPTGMTGVPPNCRKVVIKRCPQGTKGKWPKCIKIVKRPPARIKVKPSPRTTPPSRILRQPPIIK